MHSGNGQAHDHGADGIGPGPPVRPPRLQAQADPQGQRGKRHGHDDRQKEQLGIVADQAGQTHRRHAGIMHGADPGADQQSACGQLAGRELATTDHPDREQTGKNSRNGRQESDGGVVARRTGQAQGQHTHEVHGPDAHAQAQAADGNPQMPAARRRRGQHLLRHQQGCVRRKYCHRDRKQHQNRIVVTGVEQAFVRRRNYEIKKAQDRGDDLIPWRDMGTCGL